MRKLVWIQLKERVRKKERNTNMFFHPLDHVKLRTSADSHWCFCVNIVLWSCLFHVSLYGLFPWCLKVKALRKIVSVCFFVWAKSPVSETNLCLTLQSWCPGKVKGDCCVVEEHLGKTAHYCLIHQMIEAILMCTFNTRSLELQASLGCMGLGGLGVCMAWEYFRVPWQQTKGKT